MYNLMASSFFSGDYTYFIVISVNGTLAVSATVTNFLFILTILKTRSLHTPSNVLLCFLAFSDFGIGVCVQPIVIAAILSDENSEVLTSVGNKAGVILYGASFITMVVITIDRYIALKLHLRYQTIVTVSRMLKAKVLLFFLSFCGYLFRFIIPQHIRYIFIIISLLLCIFVVSYCHLQIIKIVRRHKRQIAAQTMPIAQSSPPCGSLKHGKSIKRMYYIHGCFIVCVLPYMIGVALWLKFGLTPAIVAYRYCAWTLLSVNSVLNPFLYCWRNKDIKAAIKKLVKSISRCIRQSG